MRGFYKGRSGVTRVRIWTGVYVGTCMGDMLLCFRPLRIWLLRVVNVF